MRLSFLLPGISAASRLGISEPEHYASGELTTRRGKEPATDERDEAPRLPPRDESFYWALAHSHL